MDALYHPFYFFLNCVGRKNGKGSPQRLLAARTRPIRRPPRGVQNTRGRPLVGARATAWTAGSTPPRLQTVCTSPGSPVLYGILACIRIYYPKVTHPGRHHAES